MVSPTSLVPEVTSKDFPGYSDGLSPMNLVWGQVLTRRIEPYSYWTLELDMRDSAYANLNFSFPWSSNWALLFRKNVVPSITQHDLMKIIKNGRIEHRNKIRHVRWAPSDGRPTSTINNLNTYFNNNNNSSSSNYHYRHLPTLRFPNDNASLSTSESRRLPSSSNSNGSTNRQKRDSFAADQSVLVFSEYLESGKWFLRLFNDDGLERKVSVVTNIDTNAEVRCPQQCTGNGNCVYGKCHCFDGFGGADCSISTYKNRNHTILFVLRSVKRYVRKLNHNIFLVI